MADDNTPPDRQQLLRSGDPLQLSDETNTLRLHGRNHRASELQIIVCGDQSSGKSSTLEAISGLSLPIQDTPCTRFATELVIRRAPTASVSVAIVPSPTRSAADRKWLLGFRPAAENPHGLADLIDRARDVMDLTGSYGAVYDDVLRIESAGPNLPHLTLVDLPGLIHAENKAQTAADVALIRRIVRRYAENPRSIILAVVSAANHFANQIVLQLAKDADPFGRRTLGVITKPDALPPGSDAERAFVALARNEDVEFALGWHVLRNRDYESRNSGAEARDADEAYFFRHGVWGFLPRDLLGAHALRVKLGKALERVGNEVPAFAPTQSSCSEDAETSLDNDSSATGDNWHEAPHTPAPEVQVSPATDPVPPALITREINRTPRPAETVSGPQTIMGP